jgi:outer membrane protein OmpA-like peptidoglycan-associated protein
MIKKGISPDRVTAVGYGPSRPKADNSTEAGRKANRRIEIRVVNASEVGAGQE